MIAPWLILAAALGGGALALRPVLSKSVRKWTDSGGHDVEEQHGSLVPEIAVIGGMLVGAVAFFGGGGLGLAMLGGRTASGGSAAFVYGAPNTPTLTVVVIDTSTVYALGPTFVGSGDATHDSIRFAITRLGADTTSILTETYGGAQIRDTISDNANLKADTTYKGWLKYKANPNKGGWSAWSTPDTFVNVVAVFVDGFETGARAAAQNSYNYGSNTASVTVSSTRANTGTYSLKFSYGADAVTIGDDSSAEQRFIFGAYLSEFWTEYYIYVPSNFTHRAVGGDTWNNKFFVTWGDNADYNNGSDGRILVDMEYQAQASPNGSSRLRVATTRSANADHVVYDVTGSPNGENLINDSVSPESGTWAMTPGNWHQVRIHLKLSSSKGATDGVLQLWVGGVLYYEKTTGDFYGNSPTLGDELRTMYLLGYANSGYTDVTDFFIDDFKFYNQNPGW